MLTKRLDKVLVSRQLVSEEQVKEARGRSLGSKRPIQDELVELGYITEEQIVELFTSIDEQIEKADLSKVNIDIEAVKLVPYDMTQKYSLIPLKIDKPHLICAMSNPMDIMAIDDVKNITHLEVKPMVALRSEIMEAVRISYDLDESIYDLYKNMMATDDVTVVSGETDNDGVPASELEKDASMVPIIKLVNMMIGDAIKCRASDIHLEPKTEEIELRYRVDGVLRKVMELPISLLPAVISRIKILSDMDIAERRKPQDGRTKIEVRGREIDLRVSVLPTFQGEKAVIRILDSSEAGANLDAVGFTDKDLIKYSKFLEKPQGMILITGPTGSGKTTTLYASLKQLNDGTLNITTIENPVEYQLDGINQIQINETAGMTFASSLRSILRQDPNVVLIGEIRDYETAEIAFQASQTGHLVLSTLHTNNTVSTITRLIDIGVVDFMIASSLVGVVAQRLVRKLCTNCREAYQPDRELLEKLGIPPADYTFYRETGCEECGFTGYKGRIAVFEILEINNEIKELIAQKRSESEIIHAALSNSMQTLAAAGVEKVVDGVSSVTEVERVASFGGISDMVCPECSRQISKEFLSCPFCGYTLTHICSNCNEKIDGSWSTCPYCATPTNASNSAVAQPAPATIPGPVVAAEPVAAPEASNGKTLVLVVDDEPTVRKIVSASLRKGPYEIIEAVNGKEALEKVHKQKPDLIITDVMMPEMNGYELCRKLRSTLQTGSIPIIMLTAKSDLESELEGLDAGADDYMAKPVEPLRVAMRVKAMLDRYNR
jgi:type IV pilus assembly protein PilB